MSVDLSERLNVIESVLSTTLLDSPGGRGGCACIQPSLRPSSRRRVGQMFAPRWSLVVDSGRPSSCSWRPIWELVRITEPKGPHQGVKQSLDRPLGVQKVGFILFLTYKQLISRSLDIKLLSVIYRQTFSLFPASGPPLDPVSFARGSLHTLSSLCQAFSDFCNS